MRVAVVLVSALSIACTRAQPDPAEQVERARQRADELHEKAVGLHADPHRAEKAAALHRASARLRPPSDPRVFHCYAAGAEVLMAANKLDAAMKLMEESADFALSRGDTANAARSYAVAVMIASRQKSPPRVIAFAHRVAALTAGAALAPDEATALTRRIAVPLSAAQAAMNSSPRTPAR